MTFVQAAPELANQFDDDVLLREYLERVVPEPARRRLEDEARELGALAALDEELERLARSPRSAEGASAAASARESARRALVWHDAARARPSVLEAQARRFALVLARSLGLLLLVEHGEWCRERRAGTRSLAAARLLAASPVELPDLAHDETSASAIAFP